MKLKELIEALEDIRSFVLRFDDPDEGELATSKRISRLIRLLEVNELEEDTETSTIEDAVLSHF
jgi:hypothetical protein